MHKSQNYYTGKKKSQTQMHTHYTLDMGSFISYEILEEAKLTFDVTK